MHSIVKTLVFWLVIVGAAYLLWQGVRARPAEQSPEISYSAFLARVAGGSVAKVVISGNEVAGIDKEGGAFRVIAPSYSGGMLATLNEHNVEIWFKDTSGGSVQSMLLNLAPLVLLAALWFFMIRQMKQSSRKKLEDSMNRNVS